MGDRKGAGDVVAARVCALLDVTSTHVMRHGGTLAVLALVALAPPMRGGAFPPECPTMELAVRRLEPPPQPYVEFCGRNPGHCELTGTAVLDWSPALGAALAAVNAAVNADVRFLSDPECWGLEDYWTYPAFGRGDCEDYALEKRRRLVAEGLPSAALTMAILHHREEYFPHAVLTVETDAGTWVLDNLHDAPICWADLPYRWEQRERPDGQWARFVRDDRPDR